VARGDPCYLADVLLPVFLACGHDPVIGMRIRADVTCEQTGEDVCSVSNARMPCGCNAPHFLRDEGRVEVLRDAYDPDASVVLSLAYDGEPEQFCGFDAVIVDQPLGVGGIASEGALYTVDSEAALNVVDEASLVEAGPESLTFSYPIPAGIVTETHTVEFREAMDVSTFEGIPCCGTASPAGAVSVVSAALLALLRGRR
jgi:hypothetical protein